MSGQKSRPPVEEYLEEALNAIRNEVLSIEGIGYVEAIVAFGSSSRPEDFVIGSSDIDVLVLTDYKPNRRQYLKFRDSRIDVTYASVEEARKVFEQGHPLAFLLHYDSVILKDDGAFSSLMTVKPKVTEYTLKVLRSSAFVALGLAVESYFHEDYKKSVSHAYHAIRHLARYNALKKNMEASRFPISNREIGETLSGEKLNLFTKLVEARGKTVSREECRGMLEETIHAVASGLGLKHPRLSSVEENLHGEVSLAIARETGDSMIIIVEIITEEGVKRLEIGEAYVREVKSLFEHDELEAP